MAEQQTSCGGGPAASRVGIDRREFLSQGAKVAAGTAIATTALSYGRILGANDRIALGHIGIGNRGRGLESIVSQLKDQPNVEMTAVCDLWSVNRGKAVDAARTAYGRAPRACVTARIRVGSYLDT